MILSPHIFRAYDIRGIFGEDFDTRGFEALGQAVGEYARQVLFPRKKIIRIFLSGDGRSSTENLILALVSGLSVGENIEIFTEKSRYLPTPMNVFALHADRDFDLSLQVTASHNPANYNGLKISSAVHGSLSGETLQDVFCMTQKYTGELSPDTVLIPKTVDIETLYRKKIRENKTHAQSYSIVVDAGNGIPGNFYPSMLESLGHKITPLFCDVTGDFPNHEANPEDPKNMQTLIETVQREKADFGLGFDGDGDRVGIVLRDGTLLNADKIFYILACDFLSRNPGVTIVLDIMTSASLIHALEQKSANILLSPTGHSHIEQLMRSSGAMIGGEQSGHFMFGENWYGNDDALLASVRFLNACEAHPEWVSFVSDQWASLHEYSHKIFVPEDQKQTVIEKMVVKLEMEWGKGNTIDGWRKDWNETDWVIVRMSNTSPYISVRMETKDVSDHESRMASLESLFLPFCEAFENLRT